MNCDESCRLLLRRLDAGLSDGERRALDEHVSACAACREAAAVQTEVAEVLASRPDGAVPPAFAERLSQRLAEQSGWFGIADWRWLSVRLAPITAVLLLAAGLVIERESAQPASTASLSTAMETVATGEGDRVPVTSIVWQPDVNPDSLVLAVLTASPDATIGRQADER